MVTIDFDVSVARPAEEVFEYLADPQKVVQWQAWAVDIEQVSEEARGVGARFRDVRRFLGRTIESTMEFTEYEPPKVLGLKVESGPIPFRIRQTLEAEGAGTRVRVHAEGEPGGFFKLAEPLVGRAAERQMKSDFETLKDLLETGHG
jgi:carbon monoxide dehydrogenase subunit G